MSYNNYLPPKLYAFLVKIAEENKLSIKEVQRIFLYKVAIDLGFNCDHQMRVGFAKEDPDHKPFCKDCWARLKTLRPRVVNGKRIVKEGEYWPLETFLDRYYKERVQKETGMDLQNSIIKNEIQKSDII